MKDSKVSQSLIFDGNSFHNFGAAEAKHLSPYVIVLVFGITSLIEVFCDLRFLPGLYTWRRFLMYTGARLWSALNVRVKILN